MSIECIARAVIEKDGKFLLCHSKKDGHWFFPGGHIEEGESAPEALVREIKEELGEDSEGGRFMGASENKYKTKDGATHEINLVFEEIFLGDGEYASREDHIDFGWFMHAELRETNVLPLSLRDAVLAMHAKEKPFWVSEGFAV